MLIGLVGRANSGKNSVANFMIEQGFCSIALADPMKHICQDVFGWSTDVLWGASELRSTADKRANVATCGNCGWVGQPDMDKKWGVVCGGCRASIGSDENSPCFQPLSARVALQVLGTSFGRALYPDVWIDLALRRAEAIMDPLPKIGNVPFIESVNWPEGYKIYVRGVVISDCRFINEVEAIKANGGKLIHIIRPSVKNETTGIANHASETEQEQIPDSWYSATLSNCGTIADLEVHVNALLEDLLKENDECEPT